MPLDDQPSASQEPNDDCPEKASKPSLASGKSTAAPWVRLTGAGLELAMTTLALGAIGAAVDHWVQTARPAFAAIAGLIGFSLGMIRFIRLATSVSAAQRDADADGIARAMHEEKSNKSKTEER